MSNEQLMVAKGIHDGLRALIVDFYAKLSLIKESCFAQYSPEELLFVEPLRFVVYVSGGKISATELNIINYVTGRYLSLSEVNNLIDEAECYYLDPTPQVPDLIKILQAIDTIAFCYGKTADLSAIATGVSYFGMIGRLIASSDSTFTEEKKAKINTYMDKIIEYAEERGSASYLR